MLLFVRPPANQLRLDPASAVVWRVPAHVLVALPARAFYIGVCQDRSCHDVGSSAGVFSVHQRRNQNWLPTVKGIGAASSEIRVAPPLSLCRKVRASCFTPLVERKRIVGAPSCMGRSCLIRCLRKKRFCNYLYTLYPQSRR